ncbi:HTH_Tnp_Tc3_2 domain-containing protein [Trichonephila clavipes]|nr:HTH_Tnp_Tc3_2 domain-containing protein [Trichonephila clavipes]
MYIVPLWHGDTLNSRRAPSPLVRLVEEEERWEAPDHPQGVFPQNWGTTELNHAANWMWTREGTHVRKTGSGATWKTTRRNDRRIVRQALVDPTVTRSTIRADIGVAIVPKTISRHLAEANLKSKRPFRALPLTPEYRQLRLQWCQARSIWNVTDWEKVVFSDESRFVLGTDDNRVRVWRRPGALYNFPHCPHSWCNGLGAIADDSWFTLTVMRGTLTGQRYVDDILRPHVGPFLNGLPGQFSSKIMLVHIEQELLKTSYDIFKLFHGRPTPPIFFPCRACVGSAKTVDTIVSLCT